MTETPSSANIYTKLERIALLAKGRSGEALTTLSHVIDLEWLHEAYKRTRKDGATGVDRMTAVEYAKNLEGNLKSLLDRAKSGTYRAPPVRRVRIPKGEGSETRPIGIPTFEDKVLQRAVAMVLNAVYEEDFLDCSYGFRPRRSAHQALERLRDEAMNAAGGWVVELDVRKFFDTLDHAHLRRILRKRVCDGVILRLVGKWLRAGVLEAGELSYPEAGTPQGGVISPILANVFLHEVLDSWFERQVMPRLRKKAALIRFADDAVMVFASKEDALRVLDVLAKRFDRFGLALHPEKTRMLDFRRPPREIAASTASEMRSRWGDVPRPATFDFLGFTHYWKPSRNQKWCVFRKTARSRFARAARAISLWCRSHLHDRVSDQATGLARKLHGHYAYFGITGNFVALSRLYQLARRIWRKWLSRRSSKGKVTWSGMTLLLERHPLPRPRVVHSYHT